MRTRKRSMARLTHLLRKNLVLLPVLLACASAFSQPAGAQTDQKQSQQPTVNSQTPGSTSETKPTTSQAVAQPAYLTPIAGYQGVLAETLDGTTIAEQAVDEKFNPASSVKLATTLVALQTLGPDHKFVTGIWAAW